MKPNPIDYYEDGEKRYFLKIQARDLKIELLLKFLSKTGFNYDLENFDDGRTITIKQEGDKEVGIDFFDEGRIAFAEEESE